mgnify:CR=1 FL=1
MKILIITPYFHPENFRINDLAVEYNNKGHKVSVLTPIPNYPDGKFYSGYGILKRRQECWNGIDIYRSLLIPRGSGSNIMLVVSWISSVFGNMLSALFMLNNKYDLIFVFDNQSTVNMVAPDGTDAWSAWTAFVNQDKALKKYKGKIIDRNAARQPWNNRLDLRVTQKFTNRVELTLDILNFANLLNSDWGKFEYVPYATVDLLNFQSFEDEEDVSSKPTFEFDKDRYTKTEDVYSTNDFRSRWQMLLGLRVNF